MSSERLRQIEDLYHSARERGAAVLTGTDPDLRREVEKLLAQDSESGDKLLDQSAAELLARMHVSQVEAGSLLGPYKIEAPLGEGGMGQVFRARDTRLDRTVAIKVLKEWSGRFEKESRAIAALNHPYICTLHDVGPNYLVMELIEGETLAGRLKRGSLPIGQAIRFGTQIAEALAAAHAKGVIHRDLKPANVMMTKSGVKVLDFGLAKSTADPAMSAEGVLMGTPAYMAPEQFEGRSADARTDIYALGLILREMLAGKREDLPEATPPTLVRIVKRCLEKDPDERWQSARDLQWELESLAQSQAETRPRSRSAIPAWALALAGIAIVGLAAFAISRLGQHVAPPSPVRVSIVLPEKSLVRSLAVSPDGRFVAVVLVKDGKQQIWIRALDALDMTRLEGTDDAAEPFWSADSRFLAFFADSKLKKIERTGGPVQTLCDAMGAAGGTWNRKGDILIGALDQVQRVSESGGPLTKIPGHANITELFPVFLPDGRHYLATRGSGTEAGLWLNSMDGTEARRILPDLTRAQVVAAPSGSSIGAILFARAGTLMALPFDEKKLEAAGEPYAVAQQIAAGSNSNWLESSSWNGVVAYVSGELSKRRYVWRDREGKDLGAFGDAGGVVMISPDGKRLVGDPGATTIEIQDLGQGGSRRLTVGTERGNNPVWSPDGRYVVYSSLGGLYRIAAEGGTRPELLLRTKTLLFAKSWSPDGRHLIYAQVYPGIGSDLFALPIGQPDAKPMALWQTPATSGQGEFSPDGRWVAVTSNESGQSEIYVIPFPPNPNGEKWGVSVGGGVMPRWRHDGKELFYVSPDWKMMAVDVDTHPTFHYGAPHALFDTEMLDTGIRNGPMSWDITPDGRRFLIITDKTQETSFLNVILNWRPQQ
jgi:Tol biopolymer transport system component